MATVSGMDALGEHLCVIEGRYEDIEVTRTVPVHQLLVGTLAGLVEAQRLHQKTIDLSSGSEEALVLDSQHLAADIALATGAHGIEFARSKDLCLWAVGFFINKAKENLAAALDKCLNQWLLWRLTTHEPHVEAASMAGTQEFEHIMHLWVASRLWLLESLLPFGSAAWTASRKLRDSCVKRSDPKEAEAAMKDILQWIRKCDQGGTDSPFPLGDAHCTGVVISHVNDFKHRPDANVREGFWWRASMAVTQHAMGDLLSFWDLMREDVHPIAHQKKRPPSVDRGVE